jgi:hypothetical protein
MSLKLLRFGYKQNNKGETPMSKSVALAREIYIRVIKDKILGAPKTWEVPDKQAKAIAKACLSAAQTFFSEMPRDAVTVPEDD